MTADELRAIHRAKPFRPFTLLTVEGRSFEVPAPEYFSLSPTGDTVIIFDEKDDGHILGMPSHLRFGPG